MFDKNDIAALQAMFTDLKVEIRDEIHATVKASEARLIQRMDTMKAEIVHDFASFIDISVVPQLDNHELRIEKIEHRINVI